jgi:hypothetical protein
MRPCKGTLVVRKDGTPMWCSEERTGGVCEGHSYERHRSFLSGRVSLAATAGPRAPRTSAAVDLDTD